MTRYEKIYVRFSLICYLLAAIFMGMAIYQNIKTDETLDELDKVLNETSYLRQEYPHWKDIHGKDENAEEGNAK